MGQLPAAIDLYTVPAVADGGHGVTAPGGYEWWYFDGEDVGQDVQVVGIFLDGFVFHAGYLREYGRYVRRPTKVRPPVARDYPCAYLCVYKGGKVLGQFMCQYPAGSFTAATDRVEVGVGPNKFVKRGDGVIAISMAGVPWSLTGRGPVHHMGTELSAELELRPQVVHEVKDRVFLSREMTGAAHHWVVADPMCGLSGKVRMSGEKGWELNLSGKAYHDHNYGTGPLTASVEGGGLARWIWGRAFFTDEGGGADEVYCFHFARPADGRLGDEVHLLRGRAGGPLEALASGRVWGEFDRLSSWGLRYPGGLAFGDVMELTGAEVVDSSPFYLRVRYAAKVGTGAGRKVGTALCEVAQPHRLQWPVLGRMVEMSILKVK